MQEYRREKIRLLVKENNDLKTELNNLRKNRGLIYNSKVEDSEKQS